MTYKTIIVSLNDVSRSDALLAVSMAIAAKHDAHLIGLYVIPAVRVYPEMSMHAAPAVMDAYRTFFEEHADTSEKAFVAATQKNGIEAEWRKTEISSPNIADGVIEHGLQADLIVASQVNEEADGGVEPDFCERIVMESGRPVLLIPRSGEFADIGSNIIVGWNGTREAARAVFDAMPLLEQSSATRLIWVDPQKTGQKARNLPGSEMAATLARHGINSTAEAMPTDGIGQGDALLNRASDLGADLIVMGAYGHSRMREFVFGGATRTILNHMTVPVLMSH
ncbi:MAG: universal stress protein [Rhizobiales bacterium]|nr:universal stress protein [Hyphomicrobiales bacterium]